MSGLPSLLFAFDFLVALGEVQIHIIAKTALELTV